MRGHTGTLEPPGHLSTVDAVPSRVRRSLGVSDTSEKAVGKVFDRMNGTVDCVAGDAECVQHANQGGPAIARCVATDIGCLKEAQARGATVSIVEEEQLDTVRCSSSDTRCLKRALKLSKKVQLID